LHAADGQWDVMSDWIGSLYSNKLYCSKFMVSVYFSSGGEGQMEVVGIRGGGGGRHE